MEKQINSFKDYKTKYESSVGELNLKTNEIEMIKKNYSELEEMFKFSKVNHDNEIELLQNNIHELTEYNRDVDD